MRIEAAELALAELAGDGEVIDVREILVLLPSLIERYLGIVADLGSTAQTDPERARECVRSILGQIKVRPDKGVLVAEIGLNETPLAALAGGVPIDLVAGAGFRVIRTEIVLP